MAEKTKAMNMPMFINTLTYMYPLGRPGVMFFTPGSRTRADMIYRAATSPSRAMI